MAGAHHRGSSFKKEMKNNFLPRQGENRGRTFQVEVSGSIGGKEGTAKKASKTLTFAEQ